MPMVRGTTKAPDTHSRNPPEIGTVSSPPDSGARYSVWHHILTSIDFWSRREHCSISVLETGINGLHWLVDDFVYIQCFHCLGFLKWRIDLGFKEFATHSWELLEAHKIKFWSVKQSLKAKLFCRSCFFTDITALAIYQLGIFDVILGILAQELGNPKKENGSIVYVCFGLLFHSLILSWNCRMEWCGEKSNYWQILFCLVLNWVKTAVSRSSAIINLDAINWRPFCHARCNQHEKLAPKSGVKFTAPIPRARVCLGGSVGLTTE